MTHPSDNSSSRSYQPAEFQHGTTFVLYQSDGEQSAHAELMRAEAGHRKEETRHLKNKNWIEIGKILLLGLLTYGGVFGLGIIIGTMIG